MAPEHFTKEVVEYDATKAIKDINYARSVLQKPSFLVYDPKFREILGSSPEISLVQQRSDKFAHEAGVYIKSTGCVYFTANFQTSDPIALYSVHCETNDITKLSYPDVVNGNGACNYQDKVLYCSQGDRVTPSALVLVDPKTSKSEILVNNFHGREFNSVNDVVVEHNTGDIWFTDPTYGYEQAFRPSPQLPSQIYRLKPSTGQIWCVADGFTQCNGLCFSPDYKRMYVTDTGAIQAHSTPGDGHNMSFNPRLPSAMYEYDVVDSGTRLANRRMFASCDTGVPDGIKCDEAGNVYSGCGDGVHVWDPTGTLIGKIIVGGTVANFNFAKGGIWMFGEEKLFFCKLGLKGALVHIECE